MYRDFELSFTCIIGSGLLNLPVTCITRWATHCLIQKLQSQHIIRHWSRPAVHGCSWVIPTRNNHGPLDYHRQDVVNIGHHH